MCNLDGTKILHITGVISRLLGRRLAGHRSLGAAVKPGSGRWRGEAMVTEPWVDDG
jgi:hypothetical protein